MAGAGRDIRSTYSKFWKRRRCGDYGLSLLKLRPVSPMKGEIIGDRCQTCQKDEINHPLKLGLLLLITLIPVLLIIKQPDYGTACAFLVATVFMIFAAGIKKSRSKPIWRDAAWAT